MKPARILLVEDNPADAELTKRLLRNVAGLADEDVHVAEDGSSALHFLRTAASSTAAGRLPDLVFVDLNLPVLSGLDFVAEVRKDETFGHLPVIVLSSSAAPHDVERAHALHVSAYLRKPIDLPGHRELIGVVDRYWLRTTKLPSNA